MRKKWLVLAMYVSLTVVLSGMHIGCQGREATMTMDIDNTLLKAEKWMDRYDFVVGVSEGKLNGQTAIYVHVSTKASLVTVFPKTLDNIPVVVEYMGEVSTK